MTVDPATVEANGRFVHLPSSIVRASDAEVNKARADLVGTGETRNHFLHDFWDLMGVAHTTAHARAGIAWWQTEGGATYAGAHSNWNPWNTTQTWPGSWTINSVGVRAYETREDGMQATLKTLLQARYEPIVHALRDPKTHALAICRPINDSDWGTGGAGDLIYRVLDDIRYHGLYDAYANIRVYPS